MNFLFLFSQYWEDNPSGKGALYIIAGNISIRRARSVLTNSGLDMSLETIQQAEDYFQLALEETSETGSYCRAYLGLAGVESFKSNVVSQLSGKISDIDTTALERSKAYLQLALNSEYCPLSADIAEKVDYSSAQNALTFYLVSTQEEILETAKTNYQAVITSYENNNIRVRELAALSHSGLAVVARIQNDYPSSLNEYQKALQITRVPTLKTLTLIHIGDTYLLLNDPKNALLYYQEAMLYENLLKERIGAKDLEVLKQKIEELRSGNN